nr:3-hydroxyacyl-CoA dehydrogenase NAD-binding domain-containing protein [Arthrobacter sp. JCM 19049]
MKCVEVVRNEHTSDATVEAVMQVARAMGKDRCWCRRRSPGLSPTA